jgi:hypothetical protein
LQSIQIVPSWGEQLVAAPVLVGVRAFGEWLLVAPHEKNYGARLWPGDEAVVATL